MNQNYNEMPNGYLENIHKGIQTVRTLSGRMSRGKGTKSEQLARLTEALHTADAIVIGTPIYIFNISSATQGLLERFLFSNMLYSKENAVTLGRSIRVGLIYTMGMSEVLFERTGLGDKMKLMEQSLAIISGHPVKKLHSFEGIQFSDYSKYEADKLPEAQRRIYLAEQFPKDLEQAETMGRELVQD